MSHFKDHFSDASVAYAAHRPTYPIELVDELAKLSPGHELALDCCCGTGQLSVLLAKRFDAVVATDASAAQIEQAQPHARVTYRCAVAEQSGLPDSSVDLITVAQAAHWLDLDLLYSEVRRIARPNGALALICYELQHVTPEIDRIVQVFYNDAIGAYWPPERSLVEEGYSTLPFPFRETRLPPLAMEASWRLQDFIAYIKTWSAVKAAAKALGLNPADRLEESLRNSWGAADERRRVTWPLSLRVGNV
jgi:SAM-dependent methyltransferase